jgi:hypothetical protein
LDASFSLPDYVLLTMANCLTGGIFSAASSMAEFPSRLEEREKRQTLAAGKRALTHAIASLCALL